MSAKEIIFKGIALICFGAAFYQWVTYDGNLNVLETLFPLANLAGALKQVFNWLFVCLIALPGMFFWKYATETNETPVSAPVAESDEPDEPLLTLDFSNCKLEEDDDHEPGRVEKWLSTTDEEYLDQLFDENNPVCDDCGKGKEGHKVIAVMGDKHADCIDKPIYGHEG